MGEDDTFLIGESHCIIVLPSTIHFLRSGFCHESCSRDDESWDFLRYADMENGEHGFNRSDGTIGYDSSS